MAKRSSGSKRKKPRRGAENGLLAVVRERVQETASGVRTWFAEAGLARWAELGGWTLVVVGLLVAWMVGVPRLEERTRAIAAVDAVEVRLLDPPTWLGERTVREIEAEAGAHLAGDPFDRDELITAGRVVHASGWFDEIQQVRRTAPDVIEVQARPLVPFAFVRTPGRDQLIDVTGRVLPHQLPPTTVMGRHEREGLAVITGVAAPRPAGIAPRWEGPEVQAAISLLRRLETQPWREQVASVDASRFTRDGTLDFTTDAGSVFKWGSPPGAEKPLEPTADRKLAMLDTQHASHPSGRIDRGETLRWWFFEDALNSERVGE